MGFDSLSEKLTAVFKKLKNKGKLTETDVSEAMREIKLALLSADVNFKVVKEFVKKVSERAVGEQVMKSLTPAQQVIKIVNEEMALLMTSENQKIKLKNNGTTVIMMVGLQGTGKTTHVAKLANLYKQQGRRPLMVACDIYRPAAILQLQKLGEKCGVPVFTIDGCNDAVKIASKAVEHAKKHGNDVVFIDTAGRLHIDEDMMAELKNIKSKISPDEILLTVDAMTGQDAVNVAESFNELLDITGVILTKLDGDTRGGAVLSVLYVTGKPVKFAGTGEKLGDFEEFNPSRMANRILGMGDVLSVIEKVEKAIDEEEAKKLEEKMRANVFDLDDYLSQIRQLKKMGNIRSLLESVPGVDKKALASANIDERQFLRYEAIIQSMTKKERRKPEIIDGKRRKRIALGSGNTVEEVNRLLKSYKQIKEMMKKMNKSGMMNMPGMKGGKMPRGVDFSKMGF
ncbi:MAG: signal recognition particle protein [Clostridia bacterium]|nr:signal recognition particle protein [Clostridia bacterium]